jgi:hypothetical protein
MSYSIDANNDINIIFYLMAMDHQLRRMQSVTAVHNLEWWNAITCLKITNYSASALPSHTASGDAVGSERLATRCMVHVPHSA